MSIEKKYSIYHHNSELEYILIRKKVKNINLRIKPSGEIIVSANKRVSLKYLNDFIISKWEWINKNLKVLEKRRNERYVYSYISDEKFKYLGKDIILKVIESKKEAVEYYNDKVCLYVKDVRDIDKKKKLLYKWYKGRAKKIFNKSIDDMLLIIKEYKVEKPNLTIRSMKSRWGSCLKYKNTITLNLKLITFSESCIDYVVLHELCHFIYGGHNKDFYNLLSKLMPDWKEKDCQIKREPMVDYI